jgi:hypothetical protein
MYLYTCAGYTISDEKQKVRGICFWCRMVLKYLIPVKLSLGVLPNDSLLQQYGLLEVCYVCSNNPFFTIYFLLSLFLSSGLSFLWSRVLRPCYDNNLSGQFCDQYKDVVRALRTGDIRLLRHALQTHEDQYVTVTCATTLQMFISSVGVNQSLQLQFQHGVFESLC